ncbi:MAG: hypothetical protein WBB31_07080 [Saprospiraceae bacterium]
MKTSLLSVLVFLIFFISKTSAQDKNILNGLSEEEQNAIEAIALYPAKEREAILEASLHPEILVRMENIRSTTETKFKENISGIAEADQKKIYNLSRYPDLITKICVVGNGRSNAEMTDILQSYPEGIHADALFANQNYFGLLREVNNLYMGAEEAFQTVLSAYPEKVREAFRQLDQLPGVTSILTDNMKMTVLLGDLYGKQPVQIMHALDSLNVVVAEQQANELKDWKQKIEDDPAAMTEFENAAEEFANDEPYDNSGYDDDVYDGPLPESYTERVVVHEVWRPYQYWFGWPSWYADECWYPYPWWYHSGFYYGPGHVIVIIGLPSNVFFNWHFYHDSHFYHYPHFTDQVIRHYYGPRHTGSHMQPVFKRWEEDHRSELPDNWFNDDKNRVNRIREYGKFKMDYDKKVGVKTEKSPTEREYLQKHADKYPTLKPVLTEKPGSPRTPPKKDQDNNPLPEYKPGQNNPREKITPEEKIDRAKENHENVWDNQRKPPKQESPSANPAKRDQQNKPPRTEPARKDQKQTPPRTPPTKKEQTQPKPTDTDKKKPGRN